MIEENSGTETKSLAAGDSGNALTQASTRRTALVLLAVSLGFVMAMLDVTVVNVALGDIQRTFDAPLSSLVWIIDAYTLTFAAWLLLGGAIADRIGAKRAYMLGLVWFIASSALCAVAPSGNFLIVARLLQGIGAALFMPASLSLLTEAFPDSKTRARMLGIWGAIIATAAGSGPMVGGVLVSAFGWRSIFYVNLPIGVVGAILTAIVLRPSPIKQHPFDLPSHALLMIALSGASFAMIEGPALGWGSWPITVSAVVALVAIGLVLYRESRAAHPVIPDTLSRNRRFWILNGMGFIVNFVMFGQIFAISFYLQKGLGGSALITGLRMLPMMSVLSVTNLLSGFLVVRRGVRAVIFIGLGACCVGTALVGVTGAQTSFWMLALFVAIANGGLGLAIPAMLSGVMHEAGQTNANVGAATLNANRQIGALAGVAGTGIVLHQAAPWATEMAIVFGSFAVLMLFAIVLVHRNYRANA
jgi:MFS transporter, DHA2 family, methylenomycin A resistance protein